MFFTQEDYKKIEEWLKSKSIKDTEFNDANIPLEGDEYITLIQNKSNRKIFIGDFIQQLFILGISDFLNISARYNKDRLSLIGAIRLVPLSLRKAGQVITFCNEDGNWKIYQYTGESSSTWEDTILWNDVIQAVAIATNIVPDEEDVTSVPKGDATVIKFKNKLYNPDEYSGLGRIYLRKNMQNIGTEDSPKMVNLLTQSMFPYTNSIYIIQYDYDLNNQTITIPDGCILKFEGGIFRNGVLNGANISSNKNAMIFDNVIVNSDNVYVTWFDSAENIKKDATNAFKSAIKKSSQSFYKTILVPNGDYNISDTLECMNVAIIGDSEYRESVKITFNTSSDIPLFYVKDKSGTVTSELVLMNLYIAGYSISTLERTGTCVMNDETAPSFRLKIVNCNIRRFSIGIKAFCLIDSIIKDTYIGYNYDGFITYKPASNIGTSTTFDHCYIQSNLRHVTIETNSMLDLRFTNGTIFESARNYVIRVKGGISFLLIDQCYFEANSYGYDWNGIIQDDEDVKQNILWVEADNSDVNSRYYTYVISNSFVSGSNNWSKLGKVITANAGVFQITNNVFTRFSEIFDLVSGYTARPTKFSITFNSAYYGGSAASLFTEESSTLLKNTIDDIDVNYYSTGRAFYSNPSNIRYNSTSMVEDGIENAPGVAGSVNNINIKKSGQCIASFNTAGVAVIGNTGGKAAAQANAQSNSLCLLNGTDLLSRINNTRDDKLHSYIQSMVHSLQTRLMTYVYRSDTGVFERKYLMDFKDISSTELADKSPSLYRYIIYYLTDKSTLAISNGTNWVDFLGNPVLVQSSGTFAQKPQSASGIKVGFSYFCTDKQTEEGKTNGIMIYHKGDDVWVDSLGRIVS